jgi:hypothetical protein
MKLSSKDQKQVNDFLRKYANKSYKLKPQISLSASIEHDKTLCAVCLVLRHYIKTPFYTECILSNGLRPDVIAPLHVKKFIEILHSEGLFDWEKIKGKKYKELGISKDDIIFIRTDETVNARKLS